MIGAIKNDDVTLTRDRDNRIIITTLKPLSDAQMEDLHLNVTLMARTGFTFGKIVEESLKEYDFAVAPKPKTRNIEYEFKGGERKTNETN